MTNRLQIEDGSGLTIIMTTRDGHVKMQSARETKETVPSKIVDIRVICNENAAQRLHKQLRDVPVEKLMSEGVVLGSANTGFVTGFTGLVRALDTIRATGIGLSQETIKKVIQYYKDIEVAAAAAERGARR